MIQKFKDVNLNVEFKKEVNEGKAFIIGFINVAKVVVDIILVP